MVGERAHAGRAVAGRGRPSKRTPAAETALVEALAAGATLREAAAAAGVHVATVCRWQARDPALADLLALAARVGWGVRHTSPARRPAVPWPRVCPQCGAGLEVASIWWGGLRFWRCATWPRCRFASWRPPAPGACPRCGSWWLWSHSRKSAGCPACGERRPAAWVLAQAGRG